MSEATPLPADIARCQGVQYEGQWREGCDHCRRRTDRAVDPQSWQVVPPKIIVFECEFLIPGDEQ